MTEPGGDPLLALVLLLIAFCVYFLPTLIAFLRGHKNALAIAALNIFLGWTLLGWVVALVWSLLASPTITADVRRD